MSSSSSEDDGPDGLRALDIDTRGPVIPYLYHPRKRSKSFSDSAEDEQDEKRMKEGGRWGAGRGFRVVDGELQAFGSRVR